ncbi:MAG: beta-Ala-His dipeptidase [Succinivibrionaceae bacterium]
MNNSILSLEPSKVWDYFYKICKIPHTSGNERALSDYLVSFAKDHNLTYCQQECGNVLIKKPATFGYEHCKTVCLQAHIDMVGVKKEELEFDFLNDPIETIITDDGYVKAIDTTLGADDGIGVAMILAILSDNKLQHSNIEALFTVSEETSMKGANALTKDDLSADIVINIDSEDLGEVCIGCAGGNSYSVTYTPEISDVPLNYSSFRIEISKGTGGHSGIDINKNRINAINTILTFVSLIIENGYEVNISSINGGLVRNSIPSSASVELSLESSLVPKVLNLVNELASRVKSKCIETDPNICISINNIERKNIMFSKKSTFETIGLRSLNTRVIEYTENGEPLTSCNLGAIKFENGELVFECLARFATEKGKNFVHQRLNNIIESNGAKIKAYDSYPYWEPNYESKVLVLASKTYKTLTNKDIKVSVIHAGLECGLFKVLKPTLDIISIGPDVFGAHSTNECVRIESVTTCYRWLRSMLQEVNKY